MDFYSQHKINFVEIVKIKYYLQQNSNKIIIDITKEKDDYEH